MIEVVANLSMIIILGYTHFIAGTALEIGVIFAFFAYIHLFFKPCARWPRNSICFSPPWPQRSASFACSIAKPPSRIIRRPDAFTAGFTENIFDRVNFAYKPGASIRKTCRLRSNPEKKSRLWGIRAAAKPMIYRRLNRLYDVQARCRLTG